MNIVNWSDLKIYKFVQQIGDNHKCVILDGCELPEKEFNVSGKYYPSELKLIRIVTSNKINEDVVIY